MKILSALTLWCALVLVVACGGDVPQTSTSEPTSTPTPTAARPTIVVPTSAPGWTPYSRSTYQIALPDTWQEIKLDAGGLQRAIAEAQNNNPPLAEQLRALVESGQSGAFVFYATENTGGPIVRNVSISRFALSGANDLESYSRSYADALPKVVRGSRVLEVQAPLTVNGMNAAHIMYDISMVDNVGNLQTIRGVQYLYQLASGDTYLVTVTGDVADAEKFMPLARQIGTSFVGITR